MIPIWPRRVAGMLAQRADETSEILAVVLADQDSFPFLTRTSAGRGWMAESGVHDSGHARRRAILVLSYRETLVFHRENSADLCPGRGGRAWRLQSGREDPAW